MRAPKRATGRAQLTGLERPAQVASTGKSPAALGPPAALPALLTWRHSSSYLAGIAKAAASPAERPTLSRALFSTKPHGSLSSKVGS
jgi:hypothetical protein